VNIGLVASVYEYNHYQGDNHVGFRIALYYDSFSSEPSRPPVTAEFVTFFIDKNEEGSDLDQQAIRIVDEPPLGWSEGYSQGYGLEQKIFAESDPVQRGNWALNALGCGVGLFCEPVGVALGLIDIASSWIPEPGLDFDNAETYELRARSWWRNPGYVFNENPIRQYAFNTIDWLQNAAVNPSLFMGIKVWARVGLMGANPIADIIDTPPVYLKIMHYSPPPPPPPGDGGGGCPYISVWNGTHFTLDNNLIPGAERSNGTDVTDYYMLQQPLIRGKGKYSLLIWDLDKHSFLDQARLLAVDHESSFNIAVSPYGEILTYKNPAALVTATDQNGQDVTSILSSADGDFFEGYAGDYITLDFGSLNVSEGAKLVIRADGGCEWGYCKESVHVQVSKAGGEWVNAASFIPRIYWSTDIIDMSSYLPDINGDVRVRLYFTAHHKIDYVGLDASEQGEFETCYANLAEADHSRLGEVKEILVHSDDQRVELLPSESITLEFTLPQNTEEKRDFIIVLEGHYFIIS